MTILKNIPSCITPKLLFALASMGHGDEIVLADANFPAASCAKSTTVGEEIRIDSIGIPELLAAIMALLPLDPVAKSAIFMELMPVHKEAGWKTRAWQRQQRSRGNGRRQAGPLSILSSLSHTHIRAWLSPPLCSNLGHVQGYH